MHRLLFAVSILGACGGGDDSGRLADAPPSSDAAPTDGQVDAADAAPDAAVPQNVTLTITKNGSPAREVVVYFQNADSSLVATATTDADGVAQAMMAAGGYVTAINPFTTPIPAITVAGIAPPDELRTFAGVKPGDRLVLTHDDPPESFLVRVIVPEIARGTSYELNTTCGQGVAAPPPPSVQLAAATGSVSLAGCATTDFIVVSHINDEGDRRVSAFHHPGVNVDDVASVDFTLPTPDPYKDLVDVTFSYTSVPGEISNVDVTHYLASTLGLFARPSELTVPLTSGAGSRGTLEPDVTGLIGILDSRMVQTSPHHVLVWGPNTTTYDLDMTGLLLRDVLRERLYDVAGKRVTWTEAATGASADLTTVEIDVTRSFVDDSPRRWNWRIAAPYTAAQVKFPELPIDTYTPIANDSVVVLNLINAKVPGGYDAVRARVLDVQDRESLTSFVAGATGRVVTVGEPPGVVRRTR